MSIPGRRGFVNVYYASGKVQVCGKDKAEALAMMLPWTLPADMLVHRGRTRGKRQDMKQSVAANPAELRARFHNAFGGL
jgi:hypothetical protein